MPNLVEQGFQTGGDHGREALGAHGGASTESLVHGLQEQRQPPLEVSTLQRVSSVQRLVLGNHVAPITIAFTKQHLAPISTNLRFMLLQVNALENRSKHSVSNDFGVKDIHEVGDGFRRVQFTFGS